MIDLRCGRAEDILGTLPDACCDALVTDPPSGTHFMGLAFDHNKGGRDQWIAWLAGIMAAARRVIKPGGYALVWALPRTSHWTATALDDGGWRIIDIITHHFGQGFPKGKGQLKPASEHWILCRAPGPLQPLQIDACRVATGEVGAPRAYEPRQDREQWRITGGSNGSGATSSAGRWPPNTLFSHVGGPDGCQPAGVRRVRGHKHSGKVGNGGDGQVYGQGIVFTGDTICYADAEGYESVDAWTCVDGCPIKALDEQAGPRTSGGYPPEGGQRSHVATYGTPNERSAQRFTASTGSASRFFPTFGPAPEDAVPFRYCSKASRAERNAGCEGLPAQRNAQPGYDTLRKRECRRCGSRAKAPGPAGRWPNCAHDDWQWVSQRDVGIKGGPATNTHPTVKPTALMAWLCNLVTPEGGVVLDPFCGSGSTGVACVREGFGFIGIEQSAEYVDIARARIAHEQERRGGQLALPLGHAYG